jgi:transposase
VGADISDLRRISRTRRGYRLAVTAVAPHTVAIVRMSHDPTTRAYIARRLAEGKTKREAIRCLKRYLARRMYHHLTDPTYQPALDKT